MDNWRFLPSLVNLNRLHKNLCYSLLDAARNKDWITSRMLERFATEVADSLESLAVDFTCLADAISSAEDKIRMKRVKRTIREFDRRLRETQAEVARLRATRKGNRSEFYLKWVYEVLADPGNKRKLSETDMDMLSALVNDYDDAFRRLNDPKGPGVPFADRAKVLP